MEKVLKVREVGAPALQKICDKIEIKKIDNEILDIIEDLKATLEYGTGLGIAAPQIGINKRIIVIGAKKENIQYNDSEEIPITVMINPIWKKLSEETDIQYEGCMSVPSIRGKVERYKKIELTYYNENGEKIEREVTGFFARLVQHECDHLDGIVFLEKVKEHNGFATASNINKFNLRQKSRYYFDIGSSTIKLYKYQEELEQIKEKSILFKKNYTDKGISDEHIKELIDFIKQVKKENNLDSKNTKIFATGIWRKIPEKQLKEIQNEFEKLNLVFHVISHEQENDYFEKAMYGDYNKKRIMMVNMGGKTTELVIFADNKVEEKVNLDIGVGDIIEAFPNINETDSNLRQEEIINYVINRLKNVNIDFNCQIAIHTGGELRFQKLVKYNLQENKFFKDGIHKLYVTYEDFDKKNKELLYHTKLEELHKLLPENPKWMDGAKAGILLGQAIFKKANIKYIIPSDLNLIHGVIKEEMK